MTHEKSADLAHVRILLEKLLVKFFRQLQPHSHSGVVSLADVLKTAKSLMSDEPLLQQLLTQTHQIAQKATLEDLLDMRTHAFKRLTIDRIQKAHPALEKNTSKDDGIWFSRMWLLHLINTIQTGIGHEEFAKAEALCKVLIQELQQQEGFEYKDLCNNAHALGIYAQVLSRFLDAIFTNHRHMDWFFLSMSSNPTAHTENGTTQYQSPEDSPSPTKQGIISLAGIQSRPSALENC